jgi:hypothetical protein
MDIDIDLYQNILVGGYFCPSCSNYYRIVQKYTIGGDLLWGLTVFDSANWFRSVAFSTDGLYAAAFDNLSFLFIIDSANGNLLFQYAMNSYGQEQGGIIFDSSKNIYFAPQVGYW